MKLKVENMVRAWVLVVVLVIVWSVWSQAQPATTAAGANAVAQQPAASESGATNAAGATHKKAHTNVDDTDKNDSDGDYLTFGLDQVEVLRNYQPFGQPLWKYLASLIYIFLAFYVSKFLDFLLGVWLKRLAAKTESKFDDLLLDLLRGPVKIVAFVILLNIGLNVFNWPPWVEDALSKGLKIILACSVTYMALKFVDLVTGFWKLRLASDEDRSFDEQLIPIIRKSIKAFIIVVSVLLTLPALGVNITGLIASVSIGGLALGLAAQDTLANLFGAVSIFLDKPFRVGDRILLDQIDGTVETIGLRSTRVRNADGHLITVPNKTMNSATITNVARRPNIRTVMNIGITYDTPADKVRRATELLAEILKAHPNTHDVWISFNKFNDFALNINVIHWWNNTDYKAYLAGIQELNLAIKQRFDAEKIEFAFPTQTLYVKPESGLPLPSDGPAPSPVKA